MEDLSHVRFLVRQWLIGILGSWACVWLAGPWLVNSILVRVSDPALNSITLREGDRIRWRSEGWASTLIGPHGRPGWKPNQATKRIVIWGDSQVEGLCVDDAEKIGNQAIRIAKQEFGQSIDCVPMGRSGADAADWSRMISGADDLWKPIVHVWIITDLVDLTSLVDHEDSGSGNTTRWQSDSSPLVVLAKKLRADAAFQAVRNVALDPTSGTRRSLRWSVGPVQEVNPTATGSQGDAEFLPTVLNRLKLTSRQVDDRLVLVYAPAVPRIIGGVTSRHPDDAAWEAIASRLSDSSIDAIDLRPAFVEGWSMNGKMPRGFQNGTPSFGHLNEHGNQLIATAIVEHLVESHRIEFESTSNAVAR